MWDKWCLKDFHFQRTQIGRQVIVRIIVYSRCSSSSSFLSGACCNAILPEIILYLVYYRQCVKQNLLPLLYLVDQTANSIKVFGILVFNLWKTEEWVSEIGTWQRVEARQNWTDWFSLVRNRVENEYDWKYWLGLDRYLYHRQQRKLYHCFPSVYRNFLIIPPMQIMKFWKVNTVIGALFIFVDKCPWLTCHAVFHYFAQIIFFLVLHSKNGSERLTFILWYLVILLCCFLLEQF